jgi:hypothetical protein
MRAIFVLRGAPGSGKSTWIARHARNAVVCSADHQFIGPDGVYRFEPDRLPEAHAASLRRWLEELSWTTSVPLCADNTNANLWEIAPYVMTAAAYGLRPVVVECDGLYDTHHGVPPDVVRRIRRTIGEQPIPPYWPCTVTRGS